MMLGTGMMKGAYLPSDALATTLSQTNYARQWEHAPVHLTVNPYLLQ
jgi:hypothetical protein